MLAAALLYGPFAPVHAQDAQIRSAAHRMLAAALLLLEKYHSITERIMFLIFAQQGRKNPGR
jgi:hypothetical protein